MKQKQLRQGDVLLVRVDRIPATATRTEPERGKIILAHGEATGHAHTIEADKADWWKDGAEEFVAVKTDVPVKHQEHGPLLLKAGENYSKVQQREYSPEAIRPVYD
jgi:hypothetical protein